VCVQEANLGKVAKSCTAQTKGSILPTFVQNTVLGLSVYKLFSTSVWLWILLCFCRY